MRELPTNAQRLIVLTGFMGAGKSTVGPVLAQRLGWRFIDVDVALEAAFGASVAELFSQHGEAWFRQQEYEKIAHFASQSNLVLALGGGAIEDERTRTLLLSSPKTRLIHLEASLETVLRRCQGTDDQRPIFADRANLEARYQRRLPLYRQSHLNLAVDSLSPESVAEAILNTQMTFEAEN